MRKAQIEVNCGDTTCYSEPGKPCKWLRTRKFGQIHYCMIWHDLDSSGKPLPLLEPDGWLLRRKECLESEIENETS